MVILVWRGYGIGPSLRVGCLGVIKSLLRFGIVRLNCCWARNTIQLLLVSPPSSTLYRSRLSYQICCLSHFVNPCEASQFRLSYLHSPLPPASNQITDSQTSGLWVASTPNCYHFDQYSKQKKQRSIPKSRFHSSVIRWARYVKF